MLFMGNVHKKAQQTLDKIMYVQETSWKWHAQSDSYYDYETESYKSVSVGTEINPPYKYTVVNT